MSRIVTCCSFAFGIGEAQIDKLHFVLVQHRQNVQRISFVSPPGLVMVVVVVTRNLSILLAVAVKYKAKSVPTTLPLKGVNAHHRAKGCTTQDYVAPKIVL